MNIKRIAAQFLELNNNCIYQKYVTLENKKNGLGIPRKLHKEIANECNRQYKIQNLRAERKNAIPSVREQIKLNIQKRLSQKLKEIWKFRKGANGNTFIVELSDSVSFTTEKVNLGIYSSNCSYSMFAYIFTLKIPFNYTFYVEKGRLLVVPKAFDFYQTDSNSITNFTWYQQGREIGLKKVDGFLRNGKIIDPNKMSKSRQRKVKCEVVLQNVELLEAV